MSVGWLFLLLMVLVLGCKPDPRQTTYFEQMAPDSILAAERRAEAGEDDDDNVSTAAPVTPDDKPEEPARPKVGPVPDAGAGTAD
jgi:hypothetical protein